MKYLFFSGKESKYQLSDGTHIYICNLRVVIERS